MLIDNAALDRILLWSEPVRAAFKASIAARRFVVYLAPETIAEMFAIGTTSRESRLPLLASLTIEIFNGRVLNNHFWRILEETRGHPSQAFIRAGMARSLIDNVRHLAAGGAPVASGLARPRRSDDRGRESG